MRRASVIGLALVLAACGRGEERPEASEVAPVTADWRRTITSGDRMRLREWRTSWMTALPKARAASAGAIAAEGPLFEPDRAQAGAMPPAGDYRCRVFKLGAVGTATRDFTSFPWFRCRIDDEGEVKSFHKVDGAQRPVGLFFPDTDARTVFLGTLVLGDETQPMQYGQDAARDMAGYVERVAAKRWRLVLPAPRFESLLDVVELVPE